MADAFTVETFTAGDGYVWRYRRYPAQGVPRGEVVFLHGITSHAGWYTFSCSRLAEAGFNVSFLDRRGAGMNEQARGDAPSFRRLLDDIAEYLGSLPRTVMRDDKAAKLPVFLGAHSWGGKLALALERRHPGLVDGIVLLSPGIVARVRPSLRQRLGIVASRLVWPRKRFPIPLSDPELFTATPHWQQFIRDDPLRLLEGTARLLVESVRLDAYVRWAAKYVHAPLLLLLAEHDRIVHNAKTRAYIERCAAKDKIIIEHPGSHHTLEFEPDPSLFVDDVRRWLETRLG